jgi:parallel beta-helix repeat protein
MSIKSIFVVLLILAITFLTIAGCVPSKHLKTIMDVPAGVERHLALQLKRIPDESRLKNLNAAGINLLQYIGDRSWFALFKGRIAPSLPVLQEISSSRTIQPEDRLDPRLQKGKIPDHIIGDDGLLKLTVLAFGGVDLESVIKDMESLGARVESVSAPFSTLFIRAPSDSLKGLGNIDGIQWVEPRAPRPTPEMNRARAYLNNNTAVSTFSVTGAGVEVGIFDVGHAFRHTDLYNRWIQGDTGAGQALDVQAHPSMTAGTIAGDGTLNPNYRGMAPGATIVTYSYDSATDRESNRNGDIADALGRGVEILNNSWGYAGCHDLPYGDYTLQARVYDQAVLGRDNSGSPIGSPAVVVFSAGNERDGWWNEDTMAESQDCISDKVSPYKNYGTINQPKPAKNPIVVGAVDSANDRMSVFSSWGPVGDGRLKPDIVAAGLHGGSNVAGTSNVTNQYGSPPAYANGQFYRAAGDSNNTNWYGYLWFGMTSAAAAMTSGNAALLIEGFRTQNGGVTPLPATVKAHLIHTARDLNDTTDWYNPGPDYASGYGVLDINAALTQLWSGGYLEDFLYHGGENSVSLDVPAGTTEVKVTLVWDDAPAQPGAVSALVNDLDLVVIDPQGKKHYPWTLDKSNPLANAIRTAEDHLNNVEMVLVDGSVPAGTWSIKVVGTSIPTAPQLYSLVWSPSSPGSHLPTSVYVSTLGNDVTGDGSKASPWRTIQHAVNNVANAGIIRVAQGEYDENIAVRGNGSQNKAVTLLGGYSSDFSVRDSSAYVTTINGGGRDRVVYMTWASGSSIDGFDITGGNGSGIYIEESDVTVTHNQIRNNTAGLGAGIFVHDWTHCTIENNSIHHNTGDTIVHLSVDFSTLRNNEICENQGTGIGVYEGGPPKIEGNTIRDNSGDGIASGEAKADITGNTITGNNGHGISGFQHGGTIKNNVILDNDRWGISVHSGNIAGNIVAGNRGGGISVLNNILIVNNTIVENEAGGGISLNADEPFTVVNNIIWGNTPNDLPRGGATFSNVGTGNTNGLGNISSNPGFIDPINNDYHLADTSPCIDAGANGAVPAWLTTDFEGQTRISGIVDMGADENIP